MGLIPLILGGVRLFGFDLNVVPTDSEDMSPNQALQVFFGLLDVVLVNEVDFCGPQSVSQPGLIQQPKHVGFFTDHSQSVDVFRPYMVRTFEMGSDSFNPMPIIEQLQQKRRKKLRRRRRNGGLSMGYYFTNFQMGNGFPLPELRKWPVQEGLDIEAPLGGRRRIINNMETPNLLAEVDGAQPR